MKLENWILKIYYLLIENVFNYLLIATSGFVAIVVSKVTFSSAVRVRSSSSSNDWIIPYNGKL